MADKYKLKDDILDSFSVARQSTTVTEDRLSVDDVNSILKPVLQMTSPPEKQLSPEEVKNLYQNTFQIVLNKLNESVKNGTAGKVVLYILMIVTLPMILGQIAGIMSERNLMAPLRKVARPTFLTAMEYIELRRRGVISKDEELVEKLKELGYSDDDIRGWLSMVWTIPSADDVIRFAVREAYTPDIATRFGQYEGSEDVYNTAKNDLQGAGISKELFSKFWASHWELPSIQMGYEMLHRGVINMDELKMLMRALDILPFWRDKLIQISYTPYTRVDIRRMYELGVLSRDEVKKAYKDIGYNDEKAEKMTDFTVRSIEKKEENEKTKLDKDRDGFVDLSRSDMLKGYRLGLLKKEEVVKYLQTMGYSPSDIEFMISREEYLKAQEQTDMYIKAVHDAYLKGIYNKTDVAIELGKLNLPSSYQSELLYMWDIEKIPKNNMPTKSEILGFYKRGVISLERCKTELEKLGYNKEYISWYLSGISISEEGV